MVGAVASLRRAVKRYNNGVRRLIVIVVFALWAVLALAQDPPNTSPTDKTASDKASTEKAAARDREAGESSSRETRIDVSAPKDDAKSHPGSKDAVSGLDGTDNPDVSDVQEFHPWNPLKASKDVQIGDFYFKRKNYKAALDRYKEALYYKQGDAMATFRVGECQEKLGDKAEAQKSFEQYLKILPEGPLAKDARSSLEKLAKAQ